MGSRKGERAEVGKKRRPSWSSGKPKPPRWRGRPARPLTLRGRARPVVTLVAIFVTSIPWTMALAACGSASSSPISKPRPATLHLVAIGDSIPFGQHFCGDCQTFVDLYGAYVRRRVGVPVAVSNLSQDTEINAQYGSSGYYIDYAVRHPTHPGRYVMAIECDGASYHSSECARDRDRLRQEQLERLGWNFHRIWSSDWFHNKEAAVERVLAAYQNALIQADHAATPPKPRATEPPRQAHSAEAASHPCTRSGARPAIPPHHSIADIPHADTRQLHSLAGIRRSTPHRRRTPRRRHAGTRRTATRN